MASGPRGDVSRPLVLVTGANRGIGCELARQYASHGWQVLATRRTPDDLDDLAVLGRRQPTVSIDTLDIADASSISRFVERLDGRPIDLLINNAGTMGPLPLEEHIHRQRFGGIDYDLWAQILLTNTLGTVHLTEALVENVAASRQKKIVMVSSTAGSIGESDRPAMAYTTSKAALNKASTIIARTLAPRGIVVLVMCPGHVKTRLGIGGAGVEIEDSVMGMRRVIDGMTMVDSGTFRRYNGDTIAW